jgi:hypothetical protein|tara:strand:- start:2769 stop:3002 length:234 start_codon:yes stop_codon:yes gene_type:complete
MDDISTIYGLKKVVKEAIQRNTDTLVSGNIDNMEKYHYIVGQIRAYEYVLQELSNLNEKQEQKQNDGNIIDIGSPKK